MKHAVSILLVQWFLLLNVTATGASSIIQLEGVTVTPHVQSENMQWRRPPDPELGARVELFLVNRGDAAVRLQGESPVTFDGRTPEQLIGDKVWAWHATPSSWRESSVQWTPHTMTVLTFNTLREAWGVDTAHVLSIDHSKGNQRLSFTLPRPDLWLSSVTFSGDTLASRPTEFVVHMVNHSGQSLSIQGCHVWLPNPGQSIHLFRRSPEVLNLQSFTGDRLLPSGEHGGFVARCTPLPLTYGVIEVIVASQTGARRSLWAHLRIKPEVFDISGGWVASDINGRNSLTLVPYLKMLQGMHINTAHMGHLPGYTDNKELYAQYPLKLFNKLDPVDQFDNEAVLPRVHAVEFLGEPQYGGGRPVPPQTVWEALAPYQTTRLPTTVTHSEERLWRNYAGLSDYPHYDAYRVCAPAADNWSGYERWDGQSLRWGAPLETIGDMTRSLRELNRPRAIAYWSQGAHAGWSARRPRTRSSPTPDELRTQAYHALANRITSLYWFNLSHKSLLKFPDLIGPITHVNREIRLMDRILLHGDAYEYRRVLCEGQPDWDLSSVVAPEAGLFFANDVAYAADMNEGVFRFETARQGEFTFHLPSWLASPAEVFRVDAKGTQDVDYTLNGRTLVIRDNVHVVGTYMVARESGVRARTRQRLAELLETEQRLGFDPDNHQSNRETLEGLLK